MKAQCCICADLFENCSDNNVAAAPCGHTFHEHCLMQWVEKSSTCPSCRKQLKRNQIVKRLYFDIREDQGEEQDAAMLVNEIGTLKVKVAQLTKQKKDLAEERDVIRVSLAVVEGEREASQASVKDFEQKTAKMKRELNENVKLIRCYKLELDDHRQIQKKLEGFQNIKDLLSDTQEECGNMANCYLGGGDSSIQQLCQMMTIIKQEYNKMKADKRKLKQTFDALKMKTAHYIKQLKETKTTVEVLQQRMFETTSEMNLLERENRRMKLNKKNVHCIASTADSDSNTGKEDTNSNISEDNSCCIQNLSQSYRLYADPKSNLGEESKEIEKRICGSDSEMQISIATSTSNPLASGPSADLSDHSPVSIISSGQSSSKNNSNPNTWEKKRALSDDDDDDTCNNPSGICSAFRCKSAGDSLFSSPSRIYYNYSSSKKAKTVNESREPAFMNYSIMQKKLTGFSNAWQHGKSKNKSRQFDGFGGTTKIEDEEPLGPSKNAMRKFAPKKKAHKQSPLIPKGQVDRPIPVDRFFSPTSSSLVKSSYSSNLSTSSPQHSNSSSISSKSDPKSKSIAGVHSTPKNMPSKISEMFKKHTSLRPHLSKDDDTFVDLTEF